MPAIFLAVFMAALISWSQPVSATCLDKLDPIHNILEQSLRGSQLPKYLKTAQGKFFRTQDAIASALAVEPFDLLLTDTDELRFLPHILPHHRLLLSPDSQGALNAERAEKVIAVAKTRSVAITVLWRGTGKARWLQRISRQSGGDLYTKSSIFKTLCRSLAERPFN